MKLVADVKKGFTLVEIMIVVAIIGIIIAIAVPAFLRARENARGRACQENLSKVQGAIEQYAIENKVGNDDSVTMDDLVGTEAGKGYLKEEPVCPADGESYTMPDSIADDVECEYKADEAFIQHVLPSAGATGTGTGTGT